MKAIAASAPGKVVLSGEYAVLHGAPAVSMSVTRRARVSIAPTEDSHHRVHSPGTGARAAFRAAAGGAVEWVDGAHGEFALLEHVWRAARPTLDRCVALTLDTRAFFSARGEKLGLGGSAALAVALTAALAADETPPGELLRRAVQAHRELQGGRGSGVDVATAVHGGVIGYVAEGFRVERLEWPAGLALGLLWSGRPAGTAERLARLAGLRARGAAPIAALTAAAAAVHAAWGAGAASALQALRAYTESLLRFDAASGLGIFEAGHGELQAEAARRGLVYKPCGAGGGDVGAVFAQEPAAVAELAAWARGRGFGELSPRVDARGVTMEVVEA